MNLQSCDVFSVVRYYREIIDSDVDIFSMDINQIKEYFSEDLQLNGILLTLLTKILKKKVEFLLGVLSKDDVKKEVKKIFVESIKEETGLSDATIEDLLMLDSFREKLKKPKTKIPKRITYQEFKDLTKQEILSAVACSVDYNKYAEIIYNQIKNGSFKIKDYRDFIGLMYALSFYDIDLSDLSKVDYVRFCGAG